MGWTPVLRGCASSLPTAQPPSSIWEHVAKVSRPDPMVPYAKLTHLVTYAEIYLQ